MLTLVGLLLGVAPVAIGLLAYPAMRRAGPGALRFLLALTVGLLVYLMIDTLGEGLELGAEALGRLRGETLVWVAALFTAAVLLGLGRRGGAAPRGVALAGFIALGIGLHNLGEGLVVGTALATGAAALATFLVVGFVIHNVTEGFGIAAPLTAARPTLAVFAGLATLAGLPAVLGVWAGGQAVSPYWAALCFGIGAGRDPAGGDRARGLARPRERRAAGHAGHGVGLRARSGDHVWDRASRLTSRPPLRALPSRALASRGGFCAKRA